MQVFNKTKEWNSLLQKKIVAENLTSHEFVFKYIRGFHRKKNNFRVD